MRALTFQDIEQVACDSLPEPRIEESTDAIVAVRMAAICGSDLHVYHGRESGLDTGTVLGHEFVGEIVAVGSEVRRLRPGVQVTSPFTTSCGRCSLCRSGMTARCLHGQLFGWREQGVGLHGAQAELVRVPLAETTLVQVPSAVSMEAALLAGDVLSTGYYCAHQGGVSPGVGVVVIGCGPVGLMAILAARHLGAERVLAMDRLADRLALAERFGAETVNLASAEPTAAVMAATDGSGAEVVLEAVGSPESSRLALELVRPGGTISVVGVHTEPRFAFSPVEAYDRNLTFKIGRCPARHYLDVVLPMLEARAFDPTPVISHHLPLSDGVRGYRMFADRTDSCTKVVLTP